MINCREMNWCNEMEKVGLNIQSINCLKVIYIRDINQSNKRQGISLLGGLLGLLSGLLWCGLLHNLLWCSLLWGGLLGDLLWGFLDWSCKDKNWRLGHQRLKIFKCARSDRRRNRETRLFLSSRMVPRRLDFRLLSQQAELSAQHAKVTAW